MVRVVIEGELDFDIKSNITYRNVSVGGRFSGEIGG